MSSYSNKTYIIFLDLPVEISSDIDSIIAQVLPHKNLKWTSHITIKQDEDYLVDKVVLTSLMEKIVMDMEKVPIALGEVKIHQSDLGYNVFLSLEHADLLKKIVKDISQQFECYVDRNSPRAMLSTKWEQSSDFYPHISLYGTNKETDAHKIKELLSDLTKSIKKNFVCESITLARWQDGKWLKINSYILK